MKWSDEFNKDVANTSSYRSQKLNMETTLTSECTERYQEGARNSSREMALRLNSEQLHPECCKA
jgi:hypothetical protein